MRSEEKQAQEGCRRAYGAALAAGGTAASLAPKFWSETLLQVEHRPVSARVAMYERTRSLLLLLLDRQGWDRPSEEQAPQQPPQRPPAPHHRS
jgi:hypothetical protein